MALLPRLALVSSALWLSGCNLLGHAQIGPSFVAGNDGIHAGGEVSAFGYVDMRAGDTWLDCKLMGRSCEPPEVANRFGASMGLIGRGSATGFGMSVAPGLFGGWTEARKLLLVNAAARVGFQTFDGKAHAGAGAMGAFTGGVAVRKQYDPDALVLCRSLLFLTLSLQGAVDYYPDLKMGVPSGTLLLGVLGFDDAGAPSDRGAGSTKCPR